MSDDEPEPEIGTLAGLKIVGLVLVIALVLGVVTGAYFTVDEGERAVVTRFGERVDTAGEGLHFKAPFVDRVTRYNVRKRSTTMTRTEGEGQKSEPDAISAPDQDGVQVSFDTTVRWRVKRGEVGHVYDDVARNEKKLASQFVRSDIRRAYRICTQRRTALEIYTGGMEDMEDCVKQEIASRFEPNGLEVTAVNQRAVRLPTEVAQRINEKRQLDEQLSIEEKRISIEEKKAEQRVAEAKGIRKSQRIIQSTLTRDYLRYLWITEGLEKGDAMYVPVGDDGLPIYKDVDSAGGGANGTDYRVNGTASP